MRTSARALIALAILASLLSFAKFSPCISTDWETPGQYVHACYSDLPALYGERGLNKGEWAYSNGDASVEYPVVTGAIMWAVAKIVPIGDNALQNYFYANIFFLALLFIFISLIVAKMRPEFAYLTPLA
ncbi:MAG: hypothetical protein KAZ61_02780, partial [Candidatus Planktophila sp.]|nr:hypothetical protein [Candidatus Planktophila sp.]